MSANASDDVKLRTSARLGSAAGNIRHPQEMASSHARAKDLFLKALAEPADARASFLDNACGSDAALRQEVASLLAFHEESQPGNASAHQPHGPRLVARRPPSPTDGLTPGGTHRRSLPHDLLAQATRRLEVIALLFAALWTVSTVLFHLIDVPLNQNDASRLSLLSSDGIAAAGVAISLALYFFVRRGRRTPRATLNLSLPYLVATSCLVGLISHWDPVPHSPTMPMVSWVGVLVLLFAATLPNDPTKTAVAGLISVCMSPIGMLVARERGTWDFDSTLTAWTMHYPDFLVVAVSFVIARAVYGMGQQIARARDGKLRIGRADWSWRNGRGVQSDAPDARATRGHQAHSTRSDGRTHGPTGRHRR